MFLKKRRHDERKDKILYIIIFVTHVMYVVVFSEKPADSSSNNKMVYGSGGIATLTKSRTGGQSNATHMWETQLTNHYKVESIFRTLLWHLHLFFHPASFVSRLLSSLSSLSVCLLLCLRTWLTVCVTVCLCVPNYLLPVSLLVDLIISLFRFFIVNMI